MCISKTSSPVKVDGPGKNITMALSIIFLSRSYNFLRDASLGLVCLKEKNKGILFDFTPETLIILIALFCEFDEEE